MNGQGIEIPRWDGFEIIRVEHPGQNLDKDNPEGEDEPGFHTNVKVKPTMEENMHMTYKEIEELV